jgi:hypothetical protein
MYRTYGFRARHASASPKLSARHAELIQDLLVHPPAALGNNPDCSPADGDFARKGITKPVTLTLAFNGVSPNMGDGEVAGFDASVMPSRKDFGVDGELLSDGGGAIVGDKVTITLAIEALRQADPRSAIAGLPAESRSEAGNSHTGSAARLKRRG